MGSYLPLQAHHFLTYLGPNTYMALFDCRAERKIDQVCSKESYDLMFSAMRALPATVHQVVLLLGVPIAYPRMVLAETIMESKWLPTSLLQKTGGLTNKSALFARPFITYKLTWTSADLTVRWNFSTTWYVFLSCRNINEADPGDDRQRDHWCAGPHKAERNKFVVDCSKLAKERSFRITFLSGDVHCGAVSKLFTKGDKVAPEKDAAYMLNVISSAIVNTSPPPPMISMLNKLGKKTHKTVSCSC